MNNIILCEGASDAILISYYLIHCSDWSYSTGNKGPFSVKLVNQENQVFNWYNRGADHVAIWGTGGKSLFNNAIQQLAEINRRTENDFGWSKLFILTDRDNNANEQPIIEDLNSDFRNAGIPISLINRAWTSARSLDAFKDEREIHIGLVIIPFERNGALETFVLEAIAEDEENKEIIDAVRVLISDLSTSKYLNYERQRVKAELAATLGIMHPEKTFTPINSILSNISWERYSTIQSGFALLKDL